MSNPNLLLPAVFLAAFALSLAFVPLARRLSFRLGKVYYPRADRWHKKPTPTLGGTAMFAAFIVAVLAATWIGGQAGQMKWSLLVAGGMMFGLGFVDDLKPVTPQTKLLLQVLAAALIIYFRGLINFFPWTIANILLTFFWLVGITNATNLLDNMDGLAGGVSLIASGFLSYFFIRSGNTALALASLGLAGSILGFLVFNFPPAKIFMGDSGSLFLGFTLAALAVTHRPRASDVFSVLGVPVLLFLLPILDTSLVTITRLLRGQSPARGGTDHTSHRLIAFGLNERQAVLALYAAGLLSGIAGVVLESLNYSASLLVVPLLLVGMALAVAYLGRLKVVAATNGAPGAMTRIIGELTYRRRVLEIILDFFLVGFCYLLAFWTLDGFRITDQGLRLFTRSVPVALGATFFSFFLFGVYRGMWRYLGVNDLIHYGQAATVGAALTAAPLLLFYTSYGYPPAVFFLYGIFLFLALAASRSSFRLLDQVSNQQHTSDSTPGVLLYGAGDAGELVLRYLLGHPGSLRPLGFLDDDAYLWGRHIHDIPVLGGCEQLRKILQSRTVVGIILTDPGQVPAEQLRQISAVCEEKGLWVRALKFGFEEIDTALISSSSPASHPSPPAPPPTSGEGRNGE